MDQKPVITVDGITAIALKKGMPGCEKAVLHADAPVHHGNVPRTARQERHTMHLLHN